MQFCTKNLIWDMYTFSWLSWKWNLRKFKERKFVIHRLILFVFCKMSMTGISTFMLIKKNVWPSSRWLVSKCFIIVIFGDPFVNFGEATSHSLLLSSRTPSLIICLALLPILWLFQLSPQVDWRKFIIVHHYLDIE